mgnify:CR=1 FL=1
MIMIKTILILILHVILMNIVMIIKSNHVLIFTSIVILSGRIGYKLFILSISTMIFEVILHTIIFKMPFKIISRRFQRNKSKMRHNYIMQYDFKLTNIA